MLQAMKNIAKIVQDAPRIGMIAGGAVRDIDNGKRVKDIDIFITYDTQEHINDILDYFKGQDFNGLRYGEQVPAGGDYEDGIGDIHSVHDFVYSTPNHMSDVQLIIMKRNQEQEEDIVKRVLDSFDLEICQTAMYYMPDTDKFMISKTDGYKQNKVDGVIHLTERGKALSLEQADRTRARASRIANKLNFRIDLQFDYLRQERERQVEAIGRLAAIAQNAPPVQHARYAYIGQNPQLNHAAQNWQLFNGWR